MHAQLLLPCSSSAHTGACVPCTAIDSCSCPEDDFLYGRAGYLFGCLLLNRHVRQDAVPEATMQALVESILHSGYFLHEREK
jgi:hypothetical protein